MGKFRCEKEMLVSIVFLFTLVCLTYQKLCSLRETDFFLLKIMSYGKGILFAS